MKAVLTVIGKDNVGIMAKVSTACAAQNANILEVTQSILEGYFCMVMVIDISKLACELDELADKVQESVPEMQIHVMHEDIFNSMHRI
ncbi:MAG: ACT domain-containing protein [Firmicutes bacterium]|nr:ACT domain-containing protein [Bacillota bacterium]